MDASFPFVTFVRVFLPMTETHWSKWVGCFQDFKGYTLEIVQIRVLEEVKVKVMRAVKNNMLLKLLTEAFSESKIYIYHNYFQSGYFETVPEPQ